MVEQQTVQASDALSVTQAMNLAKGALESVTVRIVGEVSEVSIKPSYKAAYFTVKDKSSALPCMMWNNRYRAQGIDLKVGQLVEITGRFTLYTAKGRMNFDVFSIALSGEGQLRLQVANLAKKLAAEGLTDPARKRRLPSLPERIGLVTSPNSAAVHDVLRTLRRRFPVAEVLLAGVPVEGAGAAAGIAQGIECVAQAGAQVVLVVRGGGSFEDLMPFNDELLARTIAACPIPVVTGVGHEVDTTIVDMVSDLRASTPTAAAEAVSPSRENLESFFESRHAALGNGVRRGLERRKVELDRIAAKPMFVEPVRLFADDALALDVAADRLSRALPARLEKQTMVVEGLNARMKQVGARVTLPFAQRMKVAASRLEDLSPVGVIARGYSIARDHDGEILRTIEQVSPGSKIEVSVIDGTVDCTVDAVHVGNR